MAQDLGVITGLVLEMNGEKNLDYDQMVDMVIREKENGKKIQINTSKKFQYY